MTKKVLLGRIATKIESHLHSQSADIAMGVDSSGIKDEGSW